MSSLQVSSQWLFYDRLVFTSFGILSVLVYGQLSDHIRRKIPLVMACIGKMLQVTVLLLNSIFMTANPAFMLLARVLEGIGGGNLVMLTGTVCYVTHVADDDMKTSRISVLYACSHVASIIAFLISGILFTNTSYVFVFALCAAIYFVTFVYTVFAVKEIYPSRDVSGTTDLERTRSTPACRRVCRKLGSGIKETLVVVFRKREGSQRVPIL